MSRNPLATLLRLREAALDEAKRTVADALTRQQATILRLNAEEDALAREMMAATSTAGGDDYVDAFARWLPIGRKAIETARVASQVAAAEVDHARVILTLSRAAHRVVELLVEEKSLRMIADMSIRLQREVDDLALQPRSA